MAKTKKPDDKAKASATLEIDVDAYIHMRNSIVTGLATLQNALSDLSSSYIVQTNLLLGEHGSDVGTALARLGENHLLGPPANFQRAATPAAAIAAASAAADGAAPDKKERKKRQHDPNAPKRPLTPFFLYMQTARPIITRDLGTEASKGDVSTEGTRRWKEMEEHDRALWSNAYEDNLRLYKARVHSYKAGNVDAKDMTEADAQAYADKHNIGADATADAQLVGEAAAAPEAADAEGEPEKEPTPPPKTPKSKGASNRKPKKATPAEIAPAPAPAPATTTAPIVPATAPASEKKDTPAASSKRKRAKKGDEPAAETEEASKSTPKPRQRKKAKADA